MIHVLFRHHYVLFSLVCF